MRPPATLIALRSKGLARQVSHWLGDWTSHVHTHILAEWCKGSAFVFYEKIGLDLGIVRQLQWTHAQGSKISNLHNLVLKMPLLVIWSFPGRYSLYHLLRA